MNRLHCVSCKTHTHASWDRTCPLFMCRCEEMDGWLPESLMPYFPTAEPWTHVSQPPKIATPTLILPPPAGPPNTGEWSVMTHRSSMCKQATLLSKLAAQGWKGADQGPSASQQQADHATMSNQIKLCPTQRWGDTDSNTGPSLPAQN